MHRLKINIFITTNWLLFLLHPIHYPGVDIACGQDRLSNDPKPGIASPTSRTIEFSGCRWFVKSGYYGPGPNYWSDSEQSVWLDDQGRLHLKIRKIGDKWYCAEVYTEKFTTYGDHRFLVEGSIDQLDKNVVLGLFTYAGENREIDIEFARWGDQNYDKVGSFTVQPYTVRGNTETFPVHLNNALSTHCFDWQPDYVMFVSLYDHHEGLLPAPRFFIHRWLYFGDYIPKNSDNLRTHINLWLFQGKSPVSTNNLEVIIHKVIQPLTLSIESDDAVEMLPLRFKIAQNFPNPFTRETVIRYWLRQPGCVTIDIFNSRGEKVAVAVNSLHLAGDHAIAYEAGNLPDGVYFYRIKGENFCQARRMVLIR